jgi:hypothetical protein
MMCCATLSTVQPDVNTDQQQATTTVKSEELFPHAPESPAESDAPAAASSVPVAPANGDPGRDVAAVSLALADSAENSHVEFNVPDASLQNTTAAPVLYCKK